MLELRPNRDHRRHDLQLRMHVLPGLRGDDAERALPELQRRAGRPSNPPGRKVGAVSSVHRASGQAGRLRPCDSIGRRRSRDDLAMFQEPMAAADFACPRSISGPFG